MRRKIPSTASLIAFESASRHQSFTLAGDELALTQSAVGRQIASLEDLIGVKLFRRTRRGVALTTAGLEYSKIVRHRLREVENDAIEIASRNEGGGSVELGVVPTFATHWLIPRLSSFYASHPDVKVNLHVKTRPFLFSESGLDATIYAGQGGWPGTNADILLNEPMAVVCAPQLIGRRKKLTHTEISTLPLIQMTTRPDAWRKWFLAHGVIADNDHAGLQVELFSMAVQAAVNGLGVALIPDYVVQNEINAGTLCAPVQNSFASGRAYYLISPEDSDRSAPLILFRDWLIQEAVKSQSSLT